MEIDDDLVQKMQRIREREAEVGREREEVRLFARKELGEIESRIDEVKDALKSLESRRDQLFDFLGLHVHDESSERLAHGALKELCFEALRSSVEGLRSSEVRSWIAKKYPGKKVLSIPATLSRQTEQGVFVRDSLGRYKIR